MPVHNAFPHLDAAVESILAQSFTDFEFVILDDASTDGSTERLRHWAEADSRIRLIEVDRNLGPAGSSNMVATAARAPFVARMDADDLSHPDRLKDELALLRDNPDVAVVASLSDMIDASGKRTRGPATWRLFQRSVFVPFAHGAMMYRREIFDRVGGYRAECEYWEDQDLIVRMAAIAKILVIQRPLYTVRQSTTSTRVVCNQERLEWALDTAYRATDCLTRGENYDQLLARPKSERGKLDPRVFIAVGSVRLWAGDNPRLFRRLLSRARLRVDLRTASAVAWTAWASASPSSLRGFLMGLLRIRNRLAFERTSPDGAVTWQPLASAKLAKQYEKARDRGSVRAAQTP
jgi:glycosyltransferase involved in cell wall biosynthesis